MDWSETFILLLIIYLKYSELPHSSFGQKAIESRVTSHFLALLATAMANFERGATTEDVWKGCIFCKTYQPRCGKFLSCLHIVCAGCMSECTSRDGSVSCLICQSRTSAKVTGVELAKQLPESSDFLYDDEVHKGETASDGDRGSGTAEIPFCDPCLDVGVEKEANHECVDCKCLPLCESHAEKHGQKRAYVEHRVGAREGPTSASQRTSSSASKRCMHHSKCNVVTYCQTCSQCICADCIAAGTHDGHEMENLPSAATKQRAKVAKVLQATGLGLIKASVKASSEGNGNVATAPTGTTDAVNAVDTANKTTYAMPTAIDATVPAASIATADNNDPTTISATTTTTSIAAVNILTASATNATESSVGITTTTVGDKVMTTEELLAAIERNITAVKEEAKVTSKMTNERFDKIEEMVKQQRDSVLSDIDHRLWTQLKPLEAKKGDLESLLQRKTAVVEVATRLTSRSVCPESVLQVADTVVENVLSVSKELHAEQAVESSAILFAEMATMDGIQEHLQQVVRVRDGVQMDISKSMVEMLVQKLQVGHEGRVAVKLVDSNGRSMPSDQPTPDISSCIILASGEKQPVQVSSSESDSSKLVIPISAAEPGTITLELCSRGVSFRSKMPVSPSTPVCFDPQKCHEAIILSNGNHVATQSPDAPEDAIGIQVLAKEGYASGRHKWAMRVIGATVGELGVGVTKLPSDGNFNSNEVFFGGKANVWRCWNGNGRAAMYHRDCPFGREEESARMKNICDGDVLVFTLDCNTKCSTLQCVNQRSQEDKKFTYIDCSQPLYPAVSMAGEGLSVEILPYP